MTATKTARVVQTCTFDWYQIVARNEELELSEPWEGDWQVAAETAGLIDEAAETDSLNYEAWVCRVTAVADRHSAIRVGDYCCCNGYGSDVDFVRLTDTDSRGERAK